MSGLTFWPLDPSTERMYRGPCLSIASKKVAPSASRGILTNQDAGGADRIAPPRPGTLSAKISGAAVRNLPQAGPRMISTVILVGDDTCAAAASAAAASTAPAHARFFIPVHLMPSGSIGN